MGAFCTCSRTSTFRNTWPVCGGAPSATISRRPRETGDVRAVLLLGRVAGGEPRTVRPVE